MRANSERANANDSQVKPTLSPRLWDISPPVDERSPVFPGDAAYAQRWNFRLGEACPVNVATVSLSPHVGAHADAPLHYHPSGESIGSLDLHPFIGPCRVIHAIGCDTGRVRWDDLAHACEDLPPRVLVRTYLQQSQMQFDMDLPAFAAETIERLADLGVRLIGIDSASIDPANSKSLPSHQAVRRRGLRVLENLLLDDVPEGDYELIALPLRWMQADASPVRAILREWR